VVEKSRGDSSTFSTNRTCISPLHIRTVRFLPCEATRTRGRWRCATVPALRLWRQNARTGVLGVQHYRPVSSNPPYFQRTLRMDATPPRRTRPTSPHLPLALGGSELAAPGANASHSLLGLPWWRRTSRRRRGGGGVVVEKDYGGAHLDAAARNPGAPPTPLCHLRGRSCLATATSPQL
jgi:hypothetical protein